MSVQQGLRVSTLLLLLAGTAAAQQTPIKPEKPKDLATTERPKEKATSTEVVPPGPALLSVYYTGAPQPTGIYLRDRGGATRKIWSGRPYDACALPDRTTLVCERSANRILWLDVKGNVIWKREDLPQPVDAELSKDGKTIVAVLNGAGTVVGLDAKTGQTKWTRSGFYNHYDVELLPDGGLVIADSGNGRVVWLDAKGRVLREKQFPFPNTVTALKNGNTLVTTYNNDTVVEVDTKGKVVWRATVPNGGSIFRAVRRSSGETVIVEGEIGVDRAYGRIHVVDRLGRIRLTEKFPAGGLVDFEPIDDI